MRTFFLHAASLLAVTAVAAATLLHAQTPSEIDPMLGAGFSSVAPFVLIIAVLFTRPYGLLGGADVRRV